MPTKATQRHVVELLGLLQGGGRTIRRNIPRKEAGTDPWSAEQSVDQHEHALQESTASTPEPVGHHKMATATDVPAQKHWRKTTEEKDVNNNTTVTIVRILGRLLYK